jgi:Aldehyde ferredoxin oxidoreductase, N-terminal domain
LGERSNGKNEDEKSRSNSSIRQHKTPPDKKFVVRYYTGYQSQFRCPHSIERQSQHSQLGRTDVSDARRYRGGCSKFRYQAEIDAGHVKLCALACVHEILWTIPWPWRVLHEVLHIVARAERITRNLDVHALIVEVQPKEDKWYNINVTKDGATIEEETELVGKWNFELIAAVEARRGKKAGIMMCGPAGEMKMALANISVKDADGHLAAGLNENDDRLPEFFKLEPVAPHMATWDFNDKEIDEFWNF